MKPAEIRDAVQRMWLTTPEAELLAWIALALAEVMELLAAGSVAPGGDRAPRTAVGRWPEAARERGRAAGS